MVRKNLIFVLVIGLSLMFMGCLGSNQKVKLPKETINGKEYTALRPAQPRSVIDNTVTEMPAKTPDEFAEENKYIPTFAFLDPVLQIAVLHPFELEKAGVENVTVFKFYASLELLVEGYIGSWPVLIELKTGEVVVATAYVSSISPDGDWLFEARVVKSKEELKGALIISSNRDGGWVYDLLGRSYDYFDPERFTEDKVYRKNVFCDIGMPLPQNARSFKVGTKEWKDYVQTINLMIKKEELNSFKNHDSKHYYTVVDKKRFMQTATRSEAFSMTSRVVKNIGFVGVDIFSFINPYGSLAKIATPVLDAGLNDKSEGLYYRASVQRSKIRPWFVKCLLINQNLIKQKNTEIKRLKSQLGQN